MKDIDVEADKETLDKLLKIKTYMDNMNKILKEKVVILNSHTKEKNKF